MKRIFPAVKLGPQTPPIDKREIGDAAIPGERRIHTSHSAPHPGQCARCLDRRHAATLHILVRKICITFVLFSCEACSLYLVLWLCGFESLRESLRILSKSRSLKGCLHWDSFPTFLRLFSDADAQVRKRRDSFASTQVIELCWVRRVDFATQTRLSEAWLSEAWLEQCHYRYHRERLYHCRLPAIKRFCSLIVGRMEIAI